MTDQPKDGGPAFPTEPRGIAYGRDYDGMSLRDWFASQIPPLDEDTDEEYARAITGKVSPPWSDRLACARYWAMVDATYRYMQADAMLAARRQA